jgi:hypothetical protein
MSTKSQVAIADSLAAIAYVNAITGETVTTSHDTTFSRDLVPYGPYTTPMGYVRYSLEMTRRNRLAGWFNTVVHANIAKTAISW